MSDKFNVNLLHLIVIPVLRRQDKAAALIEPTGHLLDCNTETLNIFSSLFHNGCITVSIRSKLDMGVRRIIIIQLGMYEAARARRQTGLAFPNQDSLGVLMPFPLARRRKINETCENDRK